MRSLLLGVMVLSVADLDAATVIPIEIVGGNNFTTTQIGSVSLKTLIDTGGHDEVGLSTRALAQVAVRFTGTFTERTDGVGNKFLCREFEIPALRLGNGVFQRVRGYERLEASGGDFGGAPFDALIGRKFLEGFTVVVDYPRRRFEPHDHASGAEVCGAPTGTIRKDSRGLVLSELGTDAGPLVMVWDTGATYSFVQKSVANARALPVHDDAYKTSKLILGDRDLGALEFVVLPIPGAPGIDGVLGYNFLSEHAVCFDHVRQVVTVR